MPRFLSADSATLAAQDLVEASQEPTQKALFSTINYTHYTALISIEEIFNIIPKVVEQK